MKEDDYMYPWEIKKFIEERNYYIGGDDLLKVISPVENPQLKGIEYKPFENKYYMWDGEGNNYDFTPMPYEEAKAKGLVKKLKERRDNDESNDKSTNDGKINKTN